jgi:dipeptidyl aminopeptidase/acylaminoacyl peptidase
MKRERNYTLFTLLLCLSCTLTAQHNGWTPAEMMKYKRVGNPVMSPDGKYVAYTIGTARMEGENSDYLTHIWLASADGKTNVQYTYGDKSCSNPLFSPDGQSLAFNSSRGKDGKSQVYIMRLAGGEAEQITMAKNSVINFTWSPDGKRLAFTMTDTLPAKEDKEKKEKKDWTVVDDFQKGQLFTVSLIKNDKGEYPLKRLTKGNFHITSFDWSPDSKTIVFAHQSSPMVDYWTDSDISYISADSGAVIPLYTSKGGDSQPLYAPDGQSIAFQSTNGSISWMRETYVMVMPAKGGAARKLAATPDQAPNLVTWSADGRNIYVNELYKTSSALYAVPIDGSAVKKLSKKESGLYGSIDMNKKGDVAYVYSTPSVAADIYATNLAFTTETKLSDAHADYMKGKTHAPSEVINWKSKDGKYDIEAILTYPAGYVQGRRYPLILNVHGGPAGTFSQGYTGASSVYPIQAFAQQGYFVLRPNPRGSGGYGADFRRANYRDWGNNDYDDLMAGVDKLIADGKVHADSLCETGWSYGGYMTSMMITKTNRFKAVMAGAPVTNLISFNGTADIPSFLPSYFGGEFWDDVKEYEEHSAMFNIKNAKTPTLVIHGLADDRVPPEQGFQLHRALQRLGVPTKMIAYPRQPHGFTEPKFIQDVGERVIEWFNMYVGKKKKAAE